MHLFRFAENYAFNNHVFLRSTLYKWERFAEFVLFRKIEFEIEN